MGGSSSILTSYSYKRNGVLPNGLELPDIPILKIAFIRRDIKKALTGEAIVDTGFDGAIYANMELAEYLEGLTPIGKDSLSSAGQAIPCELFRVKSLIIEENLKPILDLGDTKIYTPVNPQNLSNDVLVGREVVNRIKILLDGERLSILK